MSLVFKFFLRNSQPEKAILEVQAAVYNYDNNLKNWAPKDSGASRVFIFHNPSTNAYRVIGQSTHDKQVRLAEFHFHLAYGSLYFSTISTRLLKAIWCTKNCEKISFSGGLGM